MAFTGAGSLGATGSTAPNQLTLALTTGTTVNAGELVVVVVAADNIANSGDDNAVSGVTLGGTPMLKAKQVANALAAQAGASVSIWYLDAPSTVAPGVGAITATFGSATLVDASGLCAYKFSKGAGNTVAIEGTPSVLLGNTAADPGSLDVTTANIECLRVRGIASQVGNNTNLTATAGGGWQIWANGNSATTGTTAEICARAEARIATGTNFPSNPTYVSAIYASAYVAFKEVALSTTDGAGTAAGTGTATAEGATAAPSSEGVGTAAGVGTASATGTIATTADAWSAADRSANITLSNNDKTATLSSAVTGGVRSTTKYLNGTETQKFYVEFFLTNVISGFSNQVGIREVSAALNTSAGSTFQCATNSGNILTGSATNIGNIGGAPLLDGDVVCMAWSPSTERGWFRKNNGLWNNDAAADPAIDDGGLDISVLNNTDHALFFLAASSVNGGSTTILTEAADLTYSAPSGFVSWMGEALAPATTDAVGDADGVGTAAATSEATKETVGTAAGVATATAGGSHLATVAGVGDSTSTATATGVAVTINAGDGAAAGVGSASAEGASFATVAGDGSAVGVSAASATGAQTAGTSGNLAGVGTASATGQTIETTTATAAGIGAATAGGAQTAAATASASGVGAASATGEQVIPSIGSAPGVGSASAEGAVGSAAVSGDGTAAGVGAASASGAQFATASGALSGIGTAAASSSSEAYVSGAGSAPGVAAAAATGQQFATVAGAASGIGAAAATGVALGSAAVGTAAGLGTAAATGQTIATVAGAAAGIGIATAASGAIAAVAGTASGIGSAAAEGFEAAVVFEEAAGSANGVGATSGIGFAIQPSATADTRIIVAAAELRVITAAVETRVITTSAENRTIVAVAEDRTIEAVVEDRDLETSEIPRSLAA